MQKILAKSFRDLIVYQKAKAVSRLIFELSKTFPKEETYSLTDQIRRSSRSIGAQIAEAWGKRRYKQHFISKLNDSDSDQLETQHWVGDAADYRYITKDQEIDLIESLSEIGRMLNSMMKKANKFCGFEADSIRERGIKLYYLTENRSLSTKH
jgi:four helix bundle protein